MALDIAAIKAKLKGMEEGKPKSRKWKPKDEHTVRLLPLPGAQAEEDLAFIIKWHYGVDNGRQMYCPATDGNECPFCDLAQFLRSWKDEKGKDKSEAVRKRDWEWFKKVDAAVKHYAPVVVRKKDSTDLEGPFLWEMTPKTYTSVFKVCADDDYNDGHPENGGLKVLTSLTHGLDLNVSLKKKGEKGNQTTYDLTTVEERKKFTPLIKGDLAACKDLLTKIPTAGEIGTPITTEQAQKVFAAWQGSLDSSPADTADSGVEHGTNSGESAASGDKSVEDTVAALEKLLAK